MQFFRTFENMLFIMRRNHPQAWVTVSKIASVAIASFPRAWEVRKGKGAQKGAKNIPPPSRFPFFICISDKSHL